MRNRKWTVFVAAAALAATVFSNRAAQAEDFCITYKLEAKSYDEWEKMVRAKCKIGDIIDAQNSLQIGRLCDLQRPAIHAENGGALCYLAPPRKTY